MMAKHWRQPDPDERAWLYELTHGGSAGDLQFYADRCRGSANVLEVGCGTGRVLEVVAPVAGRVVGVDVDAPSLARARERLDRVGLTTVELVCGDVRELELTLAFDVAIIPFNTLFAMGGDDGVRRALRGVRAHLLPGAALYFDVYALQPEDWRAEAQWATPWEPLGIVHDGDYYVRISSRENALAGHRWRMDYRYEYDLDGGMTCGSDSLQRVEMSLHHDALDAEALLRLVEDAGFEIRSVWSDFSGTPFGIEAGVMVVEARATEAVAAEARR